MLVLEYQPIKKSFLRRWTAVLSNAAWYAAEQGRYNEAEQMDRRALDGREKVLGNEHPDTLRSVSNLASVLQHQGKYDEAEQMNRRALDSSEKVLGKEHPHTLMSVNNLGNLYKNQDKMAEAEAMYIRALKGYEKAYGAGHPSTLDTINNLAVLYSDQGKMAEAEAMYMRALKGKEKAWGVEHTSTLNTVNNLGLLYSTSISACSPDSDSSETASIASAAWSDSSKSSVSSGASDALAAGLDETTEFFLSDEELRDLFAKAFTSQNREKVLRNGVRLLKWLGRRLVISAKTTVEKETAEFFLSRRHGRSIMNRRALQIPENPTVKRTQGQIAQHQLQKHSQQLGETPSVNVGPREPSTLKTIPSFPNDVESENSTDSEDEQQIGEEKEKLNFDAAKSFLKSSDALARLKEELGDFISPFSGEAMWKKVLWIGGQQVHFELPETASQMTRIDELKLALEEHLKMPIVWWPLKQPRKWLSSNRVRMILPCVS